MSHLNIEKVSLASRDREKEEQKKNLRKKTILVLIQEYLKENGFVDTAETLKAECRFSTDDYSVCDNIHLDSIIQDFESYHFLKYQKTPQLVKKVPNIGIKFNNSKNTNTMKLKRQPRSASVQRNLSIDVPPSEIMKCNRIDCGDSYNVNERTGDSDIQLMEPLGSYGNYSADWRTLAEIVMQDFRRREKSITWAEVIGHERVKQVLKEAVVYPLKYSNLFREKSLSWKSVLLYGPSGTGKTLLASAAATESNANFFKVCCSTLVSKWRGESEKLMKVLFDLAKHYAPSIIFIDEMDALISQRGGDHEASRRLKTEFFLQMDGLSSSDKFVVLIGATNMPWELDQALLRRMEKRILVSIPEAENRICLFKKFLTSDSTHFSEKSDLDFDKLADISNLYSAFDIHLVCKEARMCGFRKAVEHFENCAEKNVYARASECRNPLKMCDVLQAIAITKPAATQDIDKYYAWKEKFGSE